MTSVSNPIALVTGGSRGIGAEIAQRLAQDGFTVAVNYTSNPAAADEVVTQIETSGGKAFAVQADISDAAAVVAMFDDIAKRGDLTVLVNNAGIMNLAPIADMDSSVFERMLNINLLGSFNTMQQAAKYMVAGGRVINTSSSVTKLLQPTYGPYAATKAAVEAMSVVFARELRGRSITVNTVAPGPTASALFLNGKTPEQIQHLENISPLQRLGQPSDIAAVVSFLAGPDGAWVNGQTLFANGGAI